MQDDYLNNKKKFQNALGEIVKKHRLKSGKSISLISAEIGMTKSIWADMEKGIKDPQLSTLWRIAEGLSIPMNELILELQNNLDNNFTFTE